MDRQADFDIAGMPQASLPEAGTLPWQNLDVAHAAPAVPLDDPAACRALQAGLEAAITQCEAALGALDDIARLVAKIRAQIAVLGERGLAGPEQDILRNNIGLLVGRIEACIARAGSNGRNLLRGEGFDPALNLDDRQAAELAGAEDGASRSLAEAATGLLAEQGGMANWLSMSPPNTFVASYLLDGFAHRVETRLVALAVQKQALEDRCAFVAATLLAAGEAPPPGLAIAAQDIAHAEACLS